MNTDGDLKLATAPGHGPGSDRPQCAPVSATRALLEEAMIEATLAAHRGWVAAGRPMPSPRRGDGRDTRQPVKIEWPPAARASARRYMADKDGMSVIGVEAQLVAKASEAACCRRADTAGFVVPLCLRRGELCRGGLAGQQGRGLGFGGAQSAAVLDEIEQPFVVDWPVGLRVAADERRREEHDLHRIR
jgi:hypothetical protein